MGAVLVWPEVLGGWRGVDDLVTAAVARDETWASLINDALDRAPCGYEANTCQVVFEWTASYAEYRHVHTCGCEVCADARYFLRVESLSTISRDILVTRL